MTDRRTIRELRAHADKVAGYGHLVAHEMVDELEELRASCERYDRILKDQIENWQWQDIAEYRLAVMRSLRASKDAGWAIAKARGKALRKGE